MKNHYNNNLAFLTNYILSFNFFKLFNTDLIEKWAIELINKDYNNDSIYMLASFSKPIDYYEIKPYLNKVFQDLGLKEHDESLAKKSCINYHMNLIQNNIDVKDNLSEVLQFYEDSYIDDFYLLYYAWEELEGEGVTYYYENVTLENIERIIVVKAKQWFYNKALN